MEPLKCCPCVSIFFTQIMTTSTKQISKNVLPLPEEILEEMAEILDSNFDYENLVNFYNPHEFVDQYGQELYDKTLEIFKHCWYKALGKTIEWDYYGNGLWAECIQEARKRIAENEEK